MINSGYANHTCMSTQKSTIEASPCNCQRNSKKKLRYDSLLLLPEGKETDTRDLDDLESDTGNISLCLSSSTETRD